MFKNSKLMKGIVLALALVLVLGIGVALKQTVGAAGTTVVYYVSDDGNNSTGKDAATAFTSIEKAIEAANALKLAPGSELKLIVPEQIYVQNRNLDGSLTLKDTAGNKIRITITSEDAGSRATILHHAFDSSGSTSYEKIILHNDITFKDIIISAEAQPYYQNNAVMTDPVDYSKLYRTRHIHVGSNDVVFDNCEITSTIPDNSKGFTLYCDSYSSSTAEGASSITLKNGNYSNCTVYVQDQVTPYWDLSLYVDNASVGTVYALADTDTGASYNAKSVTCQFNDATISSFNPMGRGNVGVSYGVTAIFEGDTVVKNWVACMSSSSSTGIYHGDFYYYFRDNCSISCTNEDSNKEKVIYLTPTIMYGDLHVTVEGGTFNNAIATGTDKNKSITSTAAILDGNIYNEFKGGTFTNYLYCGMGRAAGTVTGSIYNNFYDGVTLKKTTYLGSRIGVIEGNIHNNIYGGTVEGEIYMGGGYSESYTKKSIVEGKIFTNVYGGTFKTTFWGGPRSQVVKGGVYTTYMGGTFNGGTMVAGGIELITPELHNVFKNGPDGQYPDIKGNLYLGPRGKGEAYRGLYKVGKLYNTFEGDATFAKIVYCADGNNLGVEIDELICNTFKGGNFKGAVYGTTGSKGNVHKARVENNFYGGTFATTVYGGGQNGGSGPITNNIYGGDFKYYFYGIAAATDNQSYKYVVDGDVTNNIYGGTFGSQTCLGGYNTIEREKAGTIYNNIHGGTFNYFVYGGNNFSANYNNMDVVNNITGGEFLAWFCGGSGNARPRNITNNISGGHFVASHKEALHSEAGRTSFYGGDYGGANSAADRTLSITNNISGGVFEHRVYLGGRNTGSTGTIHSVISGGIFNGDRLVPSTYQLSGSKSFSEIILDIKPDESEQPLIFGCNYSPRGETGSSVYASYGLENMIVNKPKDEIYLYGAKKPIYICGETLLNFDEVKGAVTFIQLEDWIDGNVYVTVPSDKSLDMVTFYNAEEGLSGSAVIKQMNADLGVSDSEIGILCNVLVGSNGASAPETVTAPELAAINFVLDNNLQIGFFVKTSELAAYLEKVGSFNYLISCDGQILASGSIDSLDNAVLAGANNEYVKIQSKFEVAAFSYNEAFTLEFAGNSKDYTVYELLQAGMTSSADNAALVELLQAIYNYGVEAEKVRYGSASVSDYYDEITYTGTYNGKPTTTSFVSGNNFVSTNLSIGKEVSLNFFLQAADVEGLTFTASGSEGALEASRIVVTPFASNNTYNVVISLKLDVASMDDIYTLTAKDAEGNVLAICSNSVANCCSTYIAANNDFAALSGALLAYVEKAQAL